MLSANSAIRIPQSAIKNGILIGTSGYNYPHWWNGAFYPSDLPQKNLADWFGHMAELLGHVPVAQRTAATADRKSVV